eukprot:1173210-Pleurochrysis_carterae.AAC.2
MTAHSQWLRVGGLCCYHRCFSAARAVAYKLVPSQKVCASCRCNCCCLVYEVRREVQRRGQCEVCAVLLTSTCCPQWGAGSCAVPLLLHALDPRGRASAMGTEQVGSAGAFETNF